MTFTQRREALRAVLEGSACLHPASAAQLRVTAAPIQTWKVTDLPGLPDASVVLTVCGDLDDYDEIVYGTAGDDELIAGNGRQIWSDHVQR